MTSKTSFFNYMKKDARHRIWVPLLSATVFLLTLLAMAMSLQSYVVQNQEITEDVISLCLDIYSRDNAILTLIAVTGAIICGVQGFSYLFSKKETDFYHSLPMKREKLFLIRWVNGLLFYALPALIYTFCICLVGIVLKVPAASFAASAMIAYLHNLIIFILYYHTAILGAMLTGHILTSLAATAVLSCYALAVLELIPMYYSTYFSSYEDFSMGLMTYLEYLSPLKILSTKPGNSLLWYGFPIILSIAILAVSLFLYKKRPSEAAGKALSFRKSRHLIRDLIVIPVSLYAGLLFGSMAPTMTAFWSLLGILVFLIISHAVMEIILDFDVKSALHDKKHLALCAIIALAFMTFFVCDLMNINEKTPAMDQVKAIYMDTYMDSEMTYFDTSTPSRYSMDQTEYREENTVLTEENLPLAYDLLSLTQEGSSESDSNIYSLHVRFVKRNGQNEYRTFWYDYDTCKEALAAIYNTKEFKTGQYQIYQDNYLDNIKGLQVSNGADQEIHEANISEEDIQEITEIYKEELENLNFQEATESTPVGSLIYWVKSNYNMSQTYYIYPSFEKTITWLKNHNADLDAWRNYIPVSLTLNLDNESDEDAEYTEEYDEEYLDKEEAAAAAKEDSKEAKVCTDSEALKELLPYLITESFACRNVMSSENQNDCTSLTMILTNPTDSNVFTQDFYIENSQFNLNKLQYQGTKTN